jgi:hypothetical protein
VLAADIKSWLEIFEQEEVLVGEAIEDGLADDLCAFIRFSLDPTRLDTSLLDCQRLFVL